MPEQFKHWTSASVEAMEYAVASDFISQLQTKLDEKLFRQKDVAKALGKTEGYVSQLFNRPGNLTVKTLVKLAHTLGLKISVVAYEDPRESGPVCPEIFRKCWEAMGSPKDFFELQEKLGESDE